MVSGRGRISEGLFAVSQPATFLSIGISAASLLILLAFGSGKVYKADLHVSMGMKLINLTAV